MTSHEHRAGEPELSATQLRMCHADRLSLMGKLTATLAHDLGTPLNVIVGRAKLAANQAHDEARVRRNVEIIERQSERMTSLIRGVLSFARPGPGFDEPAALSSTLDDALRLLAPLLDKQAIRAVVTESTTLMPRMGRHGLLHVLTNLILNAFQSSPSNSVIHLAAEDVPSRGTSDQAGLEIRVEDQGHGIAPDVLPRIFEPFFSTREPMEGTGLGLAVCRILLQQHGGTVDVLHSAPGEGSVFRVWLPTLQH